MTDTKQRLRALDLIDTPDVWERALSLDPATELEGSVELPMRKRLVAITVAFALFAATGVFVWQGFRPSPPNPAAAPSDALSRTVLWPERTEAALAAAQASADAGDPGTAWRTDPAKVAERFAEDVLGWGPTYPAGGTYGVRIAAGSARGQVEAVLQRFATPCPSPAPGAVSSCPPPYEDETLALRQEATTGPTGVWSVTEVRASDDLRLDLQPGEEIPNGTSITGSVAFPSTASEFPNLSAASGIHVGADTRCAIVEGREVRQGDGSLFTVSVPPDAQAGTDCGPTPGGYAWIATAPRSLRRGDAVADPLASSGDALSPAFYGLTLVPVQVSIPENQPAHATKSPVAVVPPSALASIRDAMAPKPWEYDPADGGLPMTLAEATSILPFSPIVPPADVGASPSLIASDPDRFKNEQDRGIAWLYQDAAGPFAVIEGLAHMTEQQLEAAATCQPGETGCSTEGWSLGTLSGGHTALVIDGNMATSVDWLQNSVQYLVIGPADSFTPEHAMTIANEMEAAAG